MAQRKSVLEAKPKVILAADQQLAPRLDWRRWQTWGVFLGLGLTFGLASGAVVVFSAIAIDRVIEDRIVQVLVGIEATVAFGLIVYFALRRALPVRDVAGRIVPGNPRLEIAKLPLAVLIIFPWMMSFMVPFFGIAVLARDVVGIFPEKFPIWGANVTLLFSFMTFEVPFRVLWRAPVEEPDTERND